MPRIKDLNEDLTPQLTDDMAIDNALDSEAQKTTIENLQTTIQTDVKQVQFKTGLSEPADSEGLMFWDDENKCVAYHTDIAGVTNQISQEDWVHVYNDTAGIILNGTACYFTGNFNNEIPTVDLASASALFQSISFIGIATADIAIGERGFITQRGIVRNINTIGLSTAGALFLGETPGSITNTKPDAPSKVIVVGGVLNVHATEGIIIVNPSLGLERSIVTKDYGFTSQGINAGIFYRGGYYNSPLSDFNASEGDPDVSLGGANEPHSAHAFAVCGGAGAQSGGVVGLRINGNSITDGGVLTVADSEIISADITTLSLDDYLETDLKWVGTVEWELFTVSGTPTTFSLDFNYGLAKYEDVGNTDFFVIGIECIGISGANDTNFNIELLHHHPIGWTYHATAFVPGADTIVSFSGDLSPYDDLVNGNDFAWKRTGLSHKILGAADGNEGVIYRITTGANNSVQSMDLHIAVSIEPN